MAKLGIIDYGMGNLRSVQKGFESRGIEAVITSEAAALEAADALVLPGVGAFRDAMANLTESGLDRLVKREVSRGKPLLGICLGLQLLFSSSEEKGFTRGLDLFDGEVKRLTTELKVPHMGWNELMIHRPGPLTEGVPEGTFAYFVHSYHVVPRDPALVVASVDYGQDVVAMAGRDLVYGIQFHPEKSSTLGLRILENFGRMVDAL